MKKQICAALALLLAGLTLAGPPQADATSNLPPRAGEASTMTNGVPNLLASNVQPGELGIQGRLTVRPAAPAYGGDPGLKMMGGPGLMRPVLIAPPEPAR
jgi:hypothetical protein